MPEGRTLAANDSALRIRAFGDAEPSIKLGFIYPEPIIGLIATLFVLFVVPGIVVLTVGVATASSIRDHRFTVLHWIGAPTGWRIALGIIETLMLALPGLTLAAIVWGIIAPQLSYVPLVDHAIIRGDLGIPWWVLVATFAVCLALTALVATLVTAIRSWIKTARPRPTSQRATVKPTRIIPFGIGLVFIALSRTVGGDPTLNDTVLMLGILVMLVAVPLMFPVVLRVVGTWLRQQVTAAALIAGRTLEWDTLRTARPFAGIAVLITLSLVGSLYVALLRQSYASSQRTPETPIVAVRWLDPRSDDVARLANTLGSGIVIPIEYIGDTNMLRVGATCQQIALYLPQIECRSDVSFDMSENAKQRLAELAGAFCAQVRLEDVNVLATSRDALVFDDAALEVLHERVQVAAMQTLPVPTVTSALSNVLREPWQNAWILSGMLVGALALSIGCFISMIDRLLVTRKHRQHLINLGLSFRKLVLIEMLLFAAPYLVSIVLSLAVGIAMSVLSTYGTSTVVPWDLISTTFVLALVAGIISMVGVALLGARSALISRT
jgi:MFS family permease